MIKLKGINSSNGVNDITHTSYIDNNTGNNNNNTRIVLIIVFVMCIYGITIGNNGTKLPIIMLLPLIKASKNGNIKVF